MNANLLDAIILVTSSDNNHSGNFGTGFVIHQYEQKTYVLTCAHVVSKLGGEYKVKAAGHPAEVEALGDEDGCDLAVLSVRDRLNKLPSLKLSAVDADAREFIAVGFSTDDTKIRRIEEIRGKLDGRKIRENTERDRTWNLYISDNSEYALKADYSGAPVIDKMSGYVVGVFSQLMNENKDKGLAISIEALENGWQGVLENLIINIKPGGLGNGMNSAKQRKIERLKRELYLAENPVKELQKLIELVDSEINENRNNLAQVHMLNLKKERYKEELRLHELKVEALQAEIDELT